MPWKIQGAYSWLVFILCEPLWLVRSLGVRAGLNFWGSVAWALEPELEDCECVHTRVCSAL